MHSITSTKIMCIVEEDNTEEYFLFFFDKYQNIYTSISRALTCDIFLYTENVKTFRTATIPHRTSSSKTRNGLDYKDGGSGTQKSFNQKRRIIEEVCLIRHN